MKKILILTVTAGNGHNSCAYAMKEKLESMGDYKIKVIDMLKSYSTKMKVWTADAGYNLAMSVLPKGYEAFFNLYQRAPHYKRYSCKGQIFSVSTVNGLYKEINTYRPDVIYCTHFYGAIALTDIKLAYKLPCKTFAPVLDYENSPFWEAGIGIDYLTLPNEEFIGEFIAEGYKKEQLVCIGIPIREKFINEIDKKQAKKELGLDENVFTAMVMFGGGRWGGAYKVLKKLVKSVGTKKIQIIMINGYNKGTYRRTARLKTNENVKIVNVGFTDKVDFYMSASDVCVSKMGGLSSTEMINKKLPMLITKKVVGQEKYNLMYLEKKGVAVSFKNKKELKEKLNLLMTDEKYYNERLDNMLVLRKNGIDSLAKLIVSQDDAIYDDEYISKINYKLVKKNVKKALKKADKEARKEHKLQVKKD